MKCGICGAKWIIGNIVPYVGRCPLCNISFIENPASRIFENAEEMLITLANEEGIDIYKDFQRVNAYLYDYFPDNLEYRNLAKIILENGIHEKIYNVLEDSENKIDILHEISAIDFGEHKAGVDHLIKFICNLEQYKGDNIEGRDFWVKQIDMLSNEEHKITAIEKALQFGEDEELYLKLYKYKLKTGYVSEAESILKKCVELGNGQAMYIIGCRMMNEGKNNKAIELFYKSSDKGDEKSNFKLYQILYTTNKDKAMECLKKSVNSNYLPAMYEYAIHLFYGDDISENVPMAINLLEYCAENGEHDSIAKLKYLYTVGFKVNKDMGKANYYNSLIS